MAKSYLSLMLMQAINFFYRYYFILIIAITSNCNNPLPLNNIAGEAALRGKVVKVIDGDTFDLLTEGNTQQRVRLYGIDCPERRQAFYQAARDFLAARIAGKTVRVVRKDKDKYGRLVGIVYERGEQESENEKLIRAGLAWHYTRYDQNPVWAQLQNDARKNRLGIWSEPSPIPPWKFKRR